MLEHEERLGTARDHEGIRAPRQEDLLETLGEPDRRDVQPMVGEDAARHPELPASAVDDHQ
jgi:hypothetical protein